MYGDLRDWLSQCDTYVLGKSVRSHSQGTLRPIAVNEPAHCFGLDILGPFTTSRTKKKYLLVMTDSFSRWPELVPLSDISARTIANAFFEHVVCRHGCPQKILSDRGTQFMAELFQTLCSRLGIVTMHSLACHPKT